MIKAQEGDLSEARADCQKALDLLANDESMDAVGLRSQVQNAVDKLNKVR